MKRILIIGLATGALMLLVNLLSGFLWQLVFPTITVEYQNTQLFRPWTDPLMSLMFVHPLLTGLLLTWVYSRTISLFHSASSTRHALSFALIYWFFTLPGMIISYASFPLSFSLVLSWTVSGLLQAVCASLFLSRMIKT